MHGHDDDTEHDGPNRLIGAVCQHRPEAAARWRAAMSGEDPDEPGPLDDRDRDEPADVEILF